MKDKIPNIANLTTKITLNTKINDVKDEIPYIANLTTILLLLKIKYLVLVI